MESGASGIVGMDNKMVNSSNNQPDNAKTRQATRYGVRLFREYCNQHGVDSINNLPARDIARMLKGFYGQARTKDGQRFSVNSLIAIRYAISRYYRSPMVHRKIDIVKDNAFSEANETFRGVLRDLERESRGTTCQKELQMVDMDDRRKLRHYFEHAISTPRGLLQKVWYDLMLRVGRRGRESQRMLSKSSFRIAKAADGRQYVYQADDEEAGIIMEIPNDPLCPVKTLKFYLTRLNPACKALFQRPKEHAYEQDTCWYVNSPVGKNMLATMMSTISKCARLSRVYTNVRIRATTYSPADGKGCIPCTGVIELPKVSESSLTLAKGEDKKLANDRTENKPGFAQNSQIIKQLNAPVGQHCLPQRSVAPETTTIVSNSTVIPAIASNIFPAAFTIVKEPPDRQTPVVNQNGEVRVDNSKCTYCRKNLDCMGGIVLRTNEVGKQYCSTECLGKWMASGQPQTSSVLIPQTSAVPSDLTDANKLISMQPLDYSSSNFQKLLTLCSPANLLIPFSPSVYTDYAGPQVNEVSREPEEQETEQSANDCRSSSPQLIVPDEITPETVISDTPVPETNEATYSTNTTTDTFERKDVCDQGIMCRPSSTSLAILCKPILKNQGIQTDSVPYTSSNFFGLRDFYKAFSLSTKNGNGISKFQTDHDGDEEDDESDIVDEECPSQLNGGVFECLEDPCDTSSLRMSVEEGYQLEEVENIVTPTPLPILKQEEIMAPDIFAGTYAHRGRTTKRTTWDEIAQRSKLQTLWGVKVFREWLQSKGSHRTFENLEAILLANVLEEFYENLTKPDGEEYSVSTMHTIRASISRYLTLPPQSKPFSIIRDREFKKANEAFYRRIRRLQSPRQNYSFPTGPTTMWQPQPATSTLGLACNTNGIMLLHLNSQ